MFLVIQIFFLFVFIFNFFFLKTSKMILCYLAVSKDKVKTFALLNKRRSQCSLFSIEAMQPADLSDKIPSHRNISFGTIYQIYSSSQVRSDMWDITDQEVWGDMLLLGSSFLPVFSGTMYFNG